MTQVLMKEQATELAEKMWEKYVEYIHENGWEEKYADRLESKNTAIRIWARSLAKDPSWVPVQTICIDGIKGGEIAVGGIEEIPMDFLRVG